MSQSAKSTVPYSFLLSYQHHWNNLPISGESANILVLIKLGYMLLLGFRSWWKDGRAEYVCLVFLELRPVSLMFPWYTGLWCWRSYETMILALTTRWQHHFRHKNRLSGWLSWYGTGFRPLCSWFNSCCQHVGHLCAPRGQGGFSWAPNICLDFLHQ